MPLEPFDRTPPHKLLLGTAILAAIPFLAVLLFKAQLYCILDTSSYLAFHNVAEFFSIMVSLSIFGLGWYAYDQNQDRHTLFLSVSFLAIGLMDCMHTLGYAGMPSLLTPNNANKSTLFWIAVRFFSAAAFLASAFISPQNTSRWLSKKILMTAALLLSFAVFTSVTFFPEQLPATFVQGTGLTRFKVFSEYLIILLFILATVAYWRRLSRTSDRTICYYLSAFVFCIYSELVFGAYSSAFDTYNALGHLYKVIAFILIYKGIFIVSVRKPYKELLVSSKELLLSRNMLSHIINSIPQSIFWKDRESVYLGCNQVFASHAGLEQPEEIVGKTDFALPWGEEASEAYRADDREVMEQGRAKLHIIEKLRRSDGATIWIDTTKLPLKDSSDRTYGILGVYEDITKRKEAEEELLIQAKMLEDEIAERQKAQEALYLAKESAEAANRAKTRFLANMSHELRTPLNGVIGMTELLSYTTISDEQKSYIDALRLSSGNLLALISDILDVAKIESEQLHLVTAEYALRECINEVIATQQAEISKKGLRLDLHIPDCIPDRLLGDRLRLVQILANLLSNAVKFTEQGTITIAVTIKERHSATVLLDIMVRDTGIGIKPQLIDYIFNMFTQADESTTRKHGGAGLGLAISRRLAEMMGGSLTVESTPHKGSTFHLLLPSTLPFKQSSQEPDNAPLGVATAPSSHPLAVLVAEDNLLNLHYAQKVLEKLGHGVTSVTDGQQALAAWEQGHFDLILMDIQMPTICGDEVVRIIRQRERETDNHVPVIAVTAHALIGDQERFMEAGCDGYIAKPFQIDALAAEIERVCSETHKTRAA